MISITLTTDGHMASYNLPTSWDEVTVKQFIKLSALETDDPQSLVYIAELIAILTEVPLEAVYTMPMNGLEEIIPHLAFTKDKISTGPKDTIKIGDEVYAPIKNFNGMTFGEVASIEILLKGAKGLEYLPKLLTILIRKPDEPFTVNLVDERADMMAQLPITDVYATFINFSTGESL